VKPAEVAVVNAFAVFPTGDGAPVHPWVAEVLTTQGHHEIVEGLRAKAAAGVSKYGRHLTDWNAQALILHAAQESLDKLHYLGGALMNVKRESTSARLRSILHNQFWTEVASAQVLLQLCAEINP
jgi:hypothetical protein